MPDPMTMSPQVDQFSQTPPEEQAEQMFKDRFTKMAFSVLFSKFSEIAPSVVTFKIMETKPEEGRGIGAFIVMYNQKPVYIPVILTDGQLKPMDIFYYKELNIFLPLTPQWLDEISKMALDDMGQGAQLPQQVAQDVNIRDLILPPLTSSGRIGYASDESLIHGAKEMFKQAEDHAVTIHPRFLDVVRNAPKVVLDGMKIAFQRHPGLLQKIAAVYGVNAVTKAFNDGYSAAKAQVKTAAPDAGALRVFTKYASSDELKAAFGPKSGEAFTTILKQGYAVKDTRTGIHKVAVKIETRAILDEPGAQPGWFKLYFLDGPAENYFVVPFPADNQSMKARNVCSCVDGEWMREHKVPTEYLLISGDLKRAWKDTNIVGTRILDLKDVENTAAYKILNKGTGSTPKAGSWGFFLNVGTKGVEATAPFCVHQVTTDGGMTKIMPDSHGAMTYYIDDKDATRKKFDYAMNGNMMFIPKTAKWIEITTVPFKNGYPDYDKNPSMHGEAYRDMRRTSLIHDPKLISRWLGEKMQEAGSTPMKVKSAGLDLWWVDQTDRALGFAEALQKVATAYNIPVADAVGVLNDAQLYGQSSANALDVRNLRQIKFAIDKMAGPEMMDPSMQQQGGMMPPMQGMPPQQGMPPGMDPSQMGMGMQPPPPPPLSPTDLAISEAVQNLSQQNQMQMQQNQSQMEMLQQQMQMQQQSTQQLVGVLQGIQQRAQQISGATGGQIPEGAAGAPAMAAQALAPPPQPGQEPPPMPMMAEEPFSAETVANQINPEMVDQAADLQDQGVFDTAAIAMLSGVSALQDAVSNYVPNMETALDNLGRVLLTLQMKEPETKEAIGEESFVGLEDSLRSVFKSLGDTILMLSHNAQSANQKAQPYQASTSQTANA
jgi:hypothetical protein